MERSTRFAIQRTRKESQGPQRNPAQSPHASQRGYTAASRQSRRGGRSNNQISGVRSASPPRPGRLPGAEHTNYLSPRPHLSLAGGGSGASATPSGVCLSPPLPGRNSVNTRVAREMKTNTPGVVRRRQARLRLVAGRQRRERRATARRRRGWHKPAISIANERARAGRCCAGRLSPGAAARRLRLGIVGAISRAGIDGSAPREALMAESRTHASPKPLTRCLCSGMGRRRVGEIDSCKGSGLIS